MLDRKMIVTFFNDLDILYHHAKFGEDRTTRAGWCGVFSVTLPSGTLNSMGCII